MSDTRKFEEMNRAQKRAVAAYALALGFGSFANVLAINFLTGFPVYLAGPIVTVVTFTLLDRAFSLLSGALNSAIGILSQIIDAISASISRRSERRQFEHEQAILEGKRAIRDRKNLELQRNHNSYMATIDRLKSEKRNAYISRDKTREARLETEIQKHEAEATKIFERLTNRKTD